MNLDVLHDLVPYQVLADLRSVMKRYGINNVFRLAHFLGQVHHESGGFKFTVENLNYKPATLIKLFPRRFTDLLDAEFFARNHRELAIRLYCGKNGNRGAETTDGWDFRGRGFIQLTGRANYQEFARHVGEDVVANPDLVAKKYPLIVAGWFWSSRSLNLVADKGMGRGVIEQITKKINGGLNGLEDRVKQTQKFYKALKAGNP